MVTTQQPEQAIDWEGERNPFLGQYTVETERVWDVTGWPTLPREAPPGSKVHAAHEALMEWLRMPNPYAARAWELQAERARLADGVRWTSSSRARVEAQERVAAIDREIEQAGRRWSDEDYTTRQLEATLARLWNRYLDLRAHLGGNALPSLVGTELYVLRQEVHALVGV